MSPITYFVSAFVALLVEGFFSGSEMAMISVDRLTLRKEAQKGNSGAKIALQLLTKPENVLTTTLLGTNLCIAFQAATFTLFAYQHFGARNELFSIVFLSPLVLIFGEILPKTVFQRYAEIIVPRIAPIVRFFSMLFSPITWVLGRYTGWLSKTLQPLEEVVTGSHQPTHREELRYLLTYGRKETKLKTTERKMIRRILDFSKAEAQNASIPLVNVDMLPDTTEVSEALEAFTKKGHSRMPVYHERVDNVVGVLHVFDLFAEKDSGKSITQLMQPAFYVPETQLLDDLLFIMQRRGIQMAIVVDEYGGAVGILTLEDILEEIVGEIEDEYDEEKARYRELRPNEWLISGRMEIEAINDQLKLSIPQGDYETLAGFLLQQFNRIPEEGDELFFSGLKFVVRKASSRAIQTVYVTRIQ